MEPPPRPDRSRRPNASAARGQETRDRLLDATLRLIAAAGWGSVTTRAVAEEAGLNPGLVHYHFAAVDDLRRQAVRRCFDSVLAMSMQRLEAAVDPGTGVREVLDGLREASRADSTLSLVIIEAFLGSLRDEALRADLVAMLRGSRSQLAAWLAPYTGPAEADAVAALVLAAIDGIYLQQLIDPDIDPAVVTAPLARLVESAGTPYPEEDR